MANILKDVQNDVVRINDWSKFTNLIRVEHITDFLVSLLVYVVF